MASSRLLAQTSDRETGRKQRTHSGRLLLRMPESLHARLARAADAEGVSLNQFITSALATVVGDRQREGQPSRAAKRTVPEARRATGRGGRGLTILFLLNLVIVGAAGVVALLLLISAWRG